MPAPAPAAERAIVHLVVAADPLTAFVPNGWLGVRFAKVEGFPGQSRKQVSSKKAYGEFRQVGVRPSEGAAKD
jgi:hypothetical protein